MLRYSYSIGTASNSQDIILDDFYVSPDLSFVSGTTENIRICSVGDTIWVRSPYFPNDLPVKVTSSVLVKRNGYVLVPKILQVNKVKTYLSGGTPTEINYVEYNGNTYFSNINTGNFVINGYESEPSGNLLETREKVYIENDKLVVNGITFNATINNASDLFLTDVTGKMYLPPDKWTLKADVKPKWVTKLTIGENINSTIKCRSIGYYGHKSYIIYNNEKKYLEYFYDENNSITGAGVKIDGIEYECDSLYIIHDYDFDEGFNLYNINDYYRNENDNAVMTINGDNYIIYFEACHIPNSCMIGIETVDEHLPILLGDRITIHSIDTSNNVIVRYDEDNQGYIYLNGRRYNSVKNLCDSILLGGIEHEVVYDGDCEEPYINMILSCKADDGTLMYFQVTGVSNKKVTSIKKVEYVNGEWEDLYSMIEKEDGTVIYSATTNYEIVHYDGIRIGDYNAKIHHYKNVYYDGEVSESGDTQIVEEYDYIVLDSMLEYRLKVINTVGSNMFVCVPDVDITIYDSISKDDLVTEILYSIQGNNFVVEKRKNTFGTIDLYCDTWASEAAQNVESTSVYDLADVKANINMIRKTAHFTIPIELYKDASQKLEYNDLITNQYYNDETERAINKIVDMEKDIYSPVIKGDNDNFVNLDRIEFNLHFRTRDLETWKIIEDEGVYVYNKSGNTQVLTSNYQYCNWFVTDYYPFNKIIKDSNTINFGEVCEVSDLLGLMYFTTNDVQEKRDKLKKSFLRLTFFDSKNPEKQNMLGTSTLYFDCDRYLDVLNKPHDGIHFEEVAKSQITDRRSKVKIPRDDIMDNTENSPNVLTEAFYLPQGVREPSTNNLCIGDYQPTLNSKIIVQDRYTGNNSSEGFYSYILKAFANKKAPQTIYMKAEFFHAGVGIKIPMVIATDSDENAIQKDGWTHSKLEEFKSGYDLESVFDRLYIPIIIEYSKSLKKFVYHISYENNYLNAVLSGNKWVFNLFELKIKTK